jgi:hypothetical protein
VVVNAMAGVTAAVNNAEVTLQVDAAAAVGPRTVLVRDGNNAQRQARRTIVVT